MVKTPPPAAATHDPKRSHAPGGLHWPPVQKLPLRRLIAGPSPTPDRVFLTSLWFSGHNNPRYAELLPRLQRLDAYLVIASGGRVRRGLEYRAYHWGRSLHWAPTLRLAARQYRGMLTLANEQLRWFPGPTVSDVDDPTFSEAEVELMRRPNLHAFVVTHERAGRRFESLGVEAPWVVIPQGISMSSFKPELVEEVRASRGEGPVIGYMAASLLSAGDRNGDNPLFNVDHLLDLWNEIHSRSPEARLWLVGAASERVLTRVAGRPDVVTFGLLPREQALARMANCDVALYPRTKDQGIQAAKVAEYMGVGVPTVSYNYQVTANIGETGAGLLVDTPRQFVDAVVSLIEDEPTRKGLATAALAAGAQLDWDVLARRFEEEVLDRYLPPGG